MPSSTASAPSDRREDHDRIAELATRVLGGGMGRFAARPPDRVRAALGAGVLGLIACLTLALGFLQKSYCVRYGWGVPEVYWKACYSDLPGIAANHPLDRGLPYGAGSVVSEPVGVGMLLRLLGAFIPAEGHARLQGMFVAWAVAAALLLVVTVAATVWTCRRHPEWAAHVALSPLVVTVALVSTDLLGVALTSVALLLWSRDRPTAAGVVFGLAIASRTYPILVLLAIGILALRSGTLRSWAATAGAALVTTVVLIGGVALFYGTATLTAYQSWATGTAQLGSPWYLGNLSERPVQMGTLTLLTVLGWLLAVAVAGLIALGADVRPRVAEIAIIVVVIVLVTGKALPVQASLWLVPLVALAGVKWRDHLIWATTEVLAFVAVWLYLGGLSVPAAALPKEWYAVLLVLRLAGLCWLAVAAGHQAWTRRAPVVEHDDVAGPMTDRPDAVVVRYER